MAKATMTARVPNPPKKLWRAIQIGLRDLDKAESTPGFKVDMCVWLTTNSHCTVCFAGSVMAFSLDGVRKCREEGVKVGRVKELDESDFGPAWRRVFCALNYARSGYWSLAFEDLYDRIPYDHEVDAMSAILRIPPYGDGPKAWREAMEEAVKVLRRAKI